MRIVIGIVVGLVAAFLCIAAIEMVGSQLYPLPPGTNYSDPAAMAAIPVPALLIVALAWLVGALVGALIAFRIGRHRLAGWTIPLLVFLGAIANLLMIAHPIWMWPVGLGAPLIGGVAAERLSRRPPADAMS